MRNPPARASLLSALGLASLSLLILLPTASLANTPDGTTPAEEGVCDEVRDASPGLYGLCVAYCEAQDCDSIADAISGQCQAANPVLLDVYERKRRATDPPMPCVAPEPPPCRCFDLDDLASFSLDACLDTDYGVFTNLALSDAEHRNGAMVDVGSGWGVCALVVDGAAQVHEIEEEEALACESLLLYVAEGEGLVCQ